MQERVKKMPALSSLTTTVELRPRWWVRVVSPLLPLLGRISFRTFYPIVFRALYLHGFRYRIGGGRWEKMRLRLDDG